MFRRYFWLRLGPVEQLSGIEIGSYLWLGSVLLPVTVSEQSTLCLNKAFTSHHHPLLLVIG